MRTLMTDDSLSSHPPDICLILRVARRAAVADLRGACRSCASSSSTARSPRTRSGAALAYLEVPVARRLPARRRDRRRARPARPRARRRDRVLSEKACRYHAAVRRLRTAVAGASPRSPAALHAPADWPEHGAVRQLLRRSRTLPAVAPRFDLQSHSTHSDGALPAAEVVQRAAAAGVRAARAVRPRHDQRRLRGDRRGRARGRARRARRWRSRPSTPGRRCRANCTSWATASTTPAR